MYCRNCGAQIPDGADFCPNCGTPVQRKEQTSPAEPAKTEPPQQGSTPPEKKPADRKKDKKKKQKQSKPPINPNSKGGHTGRVILLVCGLAVVAFVGVCALSHFNVVDVPVANEVMKSVGIEKEEDSGAQPKPDLSEPYTVEPVDVDAYYEQNAESTTKIPASESQLVMTEAAASKEFSDRGFTGFPITTEYSMDGGYLSTTEISAESDTKHPEYQMFYITPEKNLWSVSIINGTIAAYPASYNMQSGNGAEIYIAESDTVTGYDNVTNTFYEVKPKESAAVVKAVDKIDAATFYQPGHNRGAGSGSERRACGQCIFHASERKRN